MAWVTLLRETTYGTIMGPAIRSVCRPLHSPLADARLMLLHHSLSLRRCTETLTLSRIKGMS